MIDFIDDLPSSQYIIADKGYDSEAQRDKIRAKKAKPVIPHKKTSKTGNVDIDWTLYRYRHLVENAFARLKHFGLLQQDTISFFATTRAH